MVTTLPAAGYFTNPSRTNGEAKTAQDNTLAFLRQSIMGATAVSTLTIVSGGITPTAAVHRVDTSGGAANLNTAVQTNTVDNQFLLLMPTNPANVVTVKHAAGGTGQFILKDAIDYVMNSVDDFIILWRDGTNWREVVRSASTYTIPDGAVTAAKLIDTIVNDFTALTAPAIDDMLAMHDTSVNAKRKIRFDDYLKVLNSLTEDTAPDTANDFLLSYDASAGAAKKVKPANIALSGLVFLGYVDAAGAASADFTSGIDSTYDDYLVIMDNVRMASSTNLCWNYRSAGVWVTTGQLYAYRCSEIVGTTLTHTQDTAGSTSLGYLTIGNVPTAPSDAGLSGKALFCSMTNGTKQKSVNFEGAHSAYNAGSFSHAKYLNSGGANGTSVADGLRFKPAGGNFSTGKFALFGIKKS